MLCCRSVAVLIVSLLLAAPLAAEPMTRYELDLSERHAQVLGVRATFDDVEGETLKVHLPVWRTGLYRVIDPVGTVSEVRVRDAVGKDLPFTQTAKSTWEITRSSAEAGSVVFEYIVYARSLEDRTRDVNSEHVFVNPGLVLVYTESHRDAPVEVSADLPEGWRAASGMDSTGPGRLVAPTYDRLVDSPFELGSFDLVEFEAAGALIQFAIYGDWDRDGERLEKDVGAIVEAAAAVFGDMPTERYVFLTHSAPGLGGGTEYYNSTVVHTDPKRFWDEDAYEDFLGLLAHEFFHLWNVKRFRPAGIARYDYLQENYTDLLWVAEGLTSYYDNLLLARSGVISVEDYRERVAENVDAVVDRAGYGRDSLAHASFEAWTKGYHQGADRRPDKANRTISFYAQGGLLGLVLDLSIRSRTAGAHSLDDVMRSLYEDYPLGSGGYSYADIRERVERFGGETLAGKLDGWVLGTEALPVSDVLATVGWSLAREGEDEEAEATLAVRTRNAAGGLQVTYVRLDGPAWRAGLNVDDVLIAIDGVQVGGELDDLLTRHAVGDTVEIAYFREGRLRSLSATLDAALRDHVVEPTEGAYEDEDEDSAEALRKAWLGDRGDPGAVEAEGDDG
ncbi:MAG: PDZ domain-containing protein [Halieaceae bacterium]|jgi:predicted metalloprotease with PDZ domain|nr:PDZ domain-containing protein [Halieaceae bacterium]